VDVADRHRGVEDAVWRWKRHWRRNGCAGNRAIRRGICVVMLGVVARFRRVGDGQKFQFEIRCSEKERVHVPSPKRSLPYELNIDIDIPSILILRLRA
jgi:hypothetical protein